MTILDVADDDPTWLPELPELWRSLPCSLRFLACYILLLGKLFPPAKPNWERKHGITTAIFMSIGVPMSMNIYIYIYIYIYILYINMSKKVIPGIGPCHLPGETPAPAAPLAARTTNQLTSHITRHRPSAWPSFQWSPRPRNVGPRRPGPPHLRSPLKNREAQRVEAEWVILYKSDKKKAIEVGIPWDTT